MLRSLQWTCQSSALGQQPTPLIPPSTPRYGFALVELLVVIAIIAVLAALVGPSLPRARVNPEAIGCLNNLKQLQTGWLMYKDDNTDVLIPNSPAGNFLPSWISGYSENWTYAPANTNRNYYLNPKYALITPYIGNQLSVYRCPADKIPSANGRRIRTYSMNSQMGAVYGLVSYNIGWKQYVRMSDIVVPKPADAFVFAEEHPGSINDGVFQVGLISPGFPDVPGSLHGKTGGISFADGHAVLHKWLTPALQVPVQYGVNVHYPSGVTASNADWLWLRDHASMPTP